MHTLLRKSASVLALGVTLALATAAQAVDFTYSSANSAFINFNGNSTFSFTTSPDSFDITSGAANGRSGDITGVFTIGAGAITAPVTGSGQFIVNASGADPFALTGNLVWNDIFQIGAAGGLNTLSASVNLTNISYGGTNAALLALANDGSAVNTLTFQFTNVLTLNDLRTQTISNSFSGAVSSRATGVPDGGTTVMMLGMGLSGLAMLRRKMSA